MRNNILQMGLKITYIAVFQVILPVTIVVASVRYTKNMIASKPKVIKRTAEKQSLTVKTIEVKAQNIRSKISGYGLVQAYRRMSIQPQVAGNVIWQNPKLIEGGIIEKGEEIFKIDPREFDIRRQQEEAKLVKAKFELKLEEGNQVVAAREWELLGDSLAKNQSSDLALRKPHLQEKKAAVKSAESSLDRAKLDLERTIITAPFTSLVISESIELGQLVNSLNSVATVADVNSFWVKVSIPVNKLSDISIPKTQGEKGSKARIVQNIGNGESNVRFGYVMGILGDLDPQGRMARVLVRVNNALAYNSNKKPMLIGSYVKVEVQGDKIPKLYKIPRFAIHQNNTVWIKNEQNKLEIRRVEIVFSNDQHSFVKNLKNGEKLIINNLSIAIPGTLLKEGDTNSEVEPGSK